MGPNSCRIRLAPFPGRRSYEVTEPGFSFFLCLLCAIVCLCSRRMFAFVVWLSFFSTGQEIGGEEMTYFFKWDVKPQFKRVRIFFEQWQWHLWWKVRKQEDKSPPHWFCMLFYRKQAQHYKDSNEEIFAALGPYLQFCYQNVCREVEIMEDSYLHYFIVYCTCTKSKL